MASFSVAQHLIALGGAALTGFGEGSAVDVEPMQAKWNVTEGVDGGAVRAFTGTRTYTIRITLLQTSLSNDLLAAIAKIDDLSARAGASGAGVLPFVVKDLGGTTVFTALQTFVMKEPAIAVTNKATDRVWELCGMLGSLYAGGNPA